MNVLLAGGAGYIGGVTLEHLLEQGHTAVVVDNLSRGFRDNVPGDVPFVDADLADTSALRRVFAGHRIDAVLHLAALALVGESIERPELYYRNNVVNGLSLLEAMTTSGVSRIVFSSSCAVYGEPDRLPIDETSTERPTNPYGETKLAFERALRWYHRAGRVRFVSLRYFNAAGATASHGERHEPETHLIPLVLQAAAGARPSMTIFGTDYPTPDGTCIRDYIHVSDLAAAHRLALDALVSDRLDAETCNLGCGGNGYSVRQVIAAARQVTGREVPVEEGPRRPGDPAVLVASSERARRQLGWSPRQQDLQAIVRSAWDWMQRSAGSAGTFAS